MYPALAVVEWLTTEQPLRGSGPSKGDGPAFLWVGKRGGLEESLVRDANVAYAGISAAAIRGRTPGQMVSAAGSLVRGWREARRWVADFRPDVLFVTGGYVCWPATLAARGAGVPVLIYLPDVVPGLAIKSLARFAARVAVSAEASKGFFRPGQAVVTGYPVRRGLFSQDKAGARQRLGVTTGGEGTGDWPVLLVFGGSQGAHSINAALVDGLAGTVDRSVVVHITGRRDFEWVKQQAAALPENLKRRYIVHAYLDQEMVDALVAADLIVSRAGASVLGEIPAVGAAGILVPYPFAGAHQKHNADLLVDAGAAVCIADETLGTTLVPMVLDLLTDHERRSSMGRAARALAQPQAAERIARELEALIG